jgi:hypothetical protein|nr:MAG TPA: hypothetical protein [Crassvirales sp.]
MMKLLRYEGYKVVIEPELLVLKPFKQIWTRDRTINKDRALAEIAFIYFMADPRSDYQYLVDEKERMEAIKEGEGLPPKWQPDRIVTEAMDFYMSFKPISALLLEDTRFMVDKYRKRLKAQEFDDLEIKDLKEVGALIKQIPPLVKDLDEAEKALNSEMKSSGKMRGSGEKTIFEDDLTL